MRGISSKVPLAPYRDACFENSTDAYFTWAAAMLPTMTRGSDEVAPVGPGRRGRKVNSSDG